MVSYTTSALRYLHVRADRDTGKYIFKNNFGVDDKKLNAVDLTPSQESQQLDGDAPSAEEQVTGQGRQLPPSWILSSGFSLKSQRTVYSACWEQSIEIPFKTEQCLRQNVLILFELIECVSHTNVSTAKTGSSSSSSPQAASGARNAYYRLAWGFLLPCPSAGVRNTGEAVRLQLFQYKVPTGLFAWRPPNTANGNYNTNNNINTGGFPSFLSKSKKDRLWGDMTQEAQFEVPDVYYVWKLTAPTAPTAANTGKTSNNSRRKYPSTLYVTLNPSNSSKFYRTTAIASPNSPHLASQQQEQAQQREQQQQLPQLQSLPLLQCKPVHKLDAGAR